ncbi:response regulator transcription factor [Oceanispirochaeta sp. M1]|uniref:response regulator transcription factor n=2 Tax=unclassified Oceanispirochaeta TaxID=2635722 RepID=UPI001314E715|nr:LuxR C-terminal-related transcriptional regulator [Oceanispirochaeta sp. M1]
MNMRKKENILIQQRISTTIAVIGFLVTFTNIIRNLYFREKDFFNLILDDPSISLVFLFSLILLLSRKSTKAAVQYLQILIFLANAALSLIDEYDAFHGMGFIILTLLLAYRYDMLKNHTKIKLISLAVFTLFFLEFSIHLSGYDQIGSSLNMILFLIFFLSIIYLIYMSEINHLLKIEKSYYKRISSMEEEKIKLIEEISNHRNEINEKEKQLSGLEERISEIGFSTKPLDLKEDYLITAREEDVIREFCNNPQLKTKEIASNLNMGLGTVKHHFNNIFKKMGVRSRSELLYKCKWNFQSE